MKIARGQAHDRYAFQWPRSKQVDEGLAIYLLCLRMILNLQQFINCEHNTVSLVVKGVLIRSANYVHDVWVNQLGVHVTITGMCARRDAKAHVDTWCGVVRHVHSSGFGSSSSLSDVVLSILGTYQQLAWSLFSCRSWSIKSKFTSFVCCCPRKEPSKGSIYFLCPLHYCLC